MATADQPPLQDADRERALARMLHHLDPAGIGTVIDRVLSIPDHHQRAGSLIALTPAPPSDRRATVMDQAILATRRIGRHDPRAGTFADSLPILETARREQVVKEALRTVAAIRDNDAGR
jgi:hypothetical protein